MRGDNKLIDNFFIASRRECFIHHSIINLNKRILIQSPLSSYIDVELAPRIGLVITAKVIIYLITDGTNVLMLIMISLFMKIEPVNFLIVDERQRKEIEEIL